MNLKNKSKKKDKRKARTPKRVTRNNPLVSDIETVDDSQQEEVPDSQESEGEDEPELVPTLPSGEWYMPDLRSTTLTEVMKKGAPYEGDNTGRILTQFPKLKPYTKFDFYLVSPYTGEVDLYDPDNSKCIAFSVKATREPVENSTIIAQIRAFMRKQNEEKWQQMYIPGEDIPTPTNTPHTITTLGEILTIFEEVCKIQGNTNLEIHQIKTGNDKDKWLELGFRNVFSERIRDRLTSIYSNLATDVALRARLGKTTYEVPSFNPHNILIKNRDGISSLCRLVNDIVGGIMDKASTLTAISTSLQPPVINIGEDASTPTNAGTDTTSAARRVAFLDEPQQDITSCLVQLSTSSTTDPQGRAGRPNINPEGPWQQYPSPNSVSSFNSNETVRCYKCGILGHYSSQCSRKTWCDNCNKDNHATAYCYSKNKPVNTSTPKLPTQEVPQTSIHNTSMQSSNDLLQTKIELDAKTKTRKYRMKKIAYYDGTNRERCLTWLEHNRTAAKDVGIPLREALLDTAHGTVYEVISATDSNMSDRELTQHVLETFSDIQTSEDTIRKLKLVRRGVEPLVTYNNKYTAIHLVAYGIDPKLQMIEQAWRTYANTLDKDLARRLNKFITYQMNKDSNRREVQNLFDVMEKVKKLQKQERKHKQYSDEKERDDATQIKDEINEVEYEETNGIFQPKFNSTMNQRNNSFGSQSSGFHGSHSNHRNSSFNQNRYTPNSSSHSPNSRQNHSQNSSVRPDRPHNTTGFSGSSAERQVDQVGTQGNSFSSSHHNSQNRSFKGSPKGSPKGSTPR